ncbi:hypothetical protein EMWEY_00013870 [Eimeria maxima]|uniref:Uncharacterized protein n=1 Tax=Eimeria maxima TaxID=5804 RepID=U6M0R3_EIMMA|nr:hypothetical protein EMWEY_00013870 [Eimeria maxima]CDJ56019.1 hypothetical protein EMWEY_00013870 [Eimeria maxima]
MPPSVSLREETVDGDTLKVIVQATHRKSNDHPGCIRASTNSLRLALARHSKELLEQLSSPPSRLRRQSTF